MATKKAKVKPKKEEKPEAEQGAPKGVPSETEGKEVGKVTHYFDKVGVAVVELKAGLKVGDKIKVKGTTTDFEQKIDSMQVEHEELEKAKKGQAIGLKVKKRARLNDIVYVL